MTLRIEPRMARASAIAGGIVWIALLFIRTSNSFETQLIQRILLLGVLVIVPLGLSLSSLSEDRQSWSYRLALTLQPFGAAAVVGSVFLSPGVAAAGLASVWLISTGLIALVGLTRLLRPDLRSAADISIDAGLLYIPVGAAWLGMSRLGVQPFGFGDTIVLLTAVHFHFAGFAAPILAGLAGHTLSDSGNVHRTFRLAAIGIIAGTPLVAAGITFSPALALVGAIVITLGLVTLSVLVVGWVVPSLSSVVPQILLVISSVATLPAMLLACTYAYSIVFNKQIVDIPQMAMTHGIANSFGFALCGLVAWTVRNDIAQKVIRPVRAADD